MCHKCTKAVTCFSLIGKLVDVQSDRTSFVSPLVFFGGVQISLRVAGVIGHPQRHRSARNSNLTNKEITRETASSFLPFTESEVPGLFSNRGGNHSA